MKKLLLAVAVVGGALIAYRKAAAERSEGDLWAEATDPYR
jgi:hypothetical protein